MNMKKTIAAVAACAMAVSAMATTVSAVDENATAAKSVHYDLTVKSKAKTADLTFTAKSISNAPTKLEIIVPKSIAKSIPSDISVVVADRSTKTQYTFAFTTNKGANYDGVAIKTEEDLNSTGSPDSWVYTIDLSVVQATAIKNAFAGTTDGVDATVTMNGVILADGIGQTEVSDALTTATGSFISKGAAEAGKIALVDGTQSYNGRGAVAETTVTKPMKSQINTNSETAEIFTILGTKGTKSVDTYYVNAKAVINDMIANYDDVVFTFNTAVDNVFTKAILDANDQQGNWYTDSIKREYTDYYVTGVPGADASWMGDSQYKSFAQQLYNLFGDEGTGFTYSDSYTFNNLFNAALVANNGYTMNQSTVAPFEYSKTSVSFNWSDLTGGNAYITAANTLNTLQLASSSDWYWDSMDVTGYELAAEDASTEAGIEDEGEDLDDEDDADDVDDIDDADDDADDIDDVDDIDDADVDADVENEAPVATNPATGNAPIALAVIPVALAAAAVVAKKRG